ncbi:GNAT family N-acetyltransferase [Anaerobranca gottschalkii]|uniref:Acetyltransferase (GNAT) family protein n=1 Tax=Anaerobranca gottschalkii DSM 13577 TaxID=1120990 RepID=A0A1I0BRL4_9FIRM|nr:GNAT family N-acetyltransferase [Anaerobranca gottschalkii]SET09593.1 Acetyltransferase (GNAT) family protein [Anaerobranca gottschalkii DSM 13577]
MEVVKLTKGLDVNILFQDMIKNYQREFGKGVGKYIQNKLDIIQFGEIPAYLLKNGDEIVGYFEYEKVAENKVCFYVLYVTKRYRKKEVVQYFVKHTLLKLQEEGINHFVAHINPLSTLPLEVSLTGCGFKKYLRNEMSIKLRDFNPTLNLEVYPFDVKYLDKLKSLMILVFKDTIDSQIYSEFFTLKGQEGVLKRIFTGFYGRFLANNSLILVEQGEVIGYALVTAKDCHTAFLMDFGIHPRFQGKGYGKNLLYYLSNSLRKENYKYLNLAVTEENTRAYNLYKKFGFSIVGEFTIYML